ncbi:MAG: alpha/beta hydrolase [Dehalococcoidia bacterium]
MATATRGRRKRLLPRTVLYVGLALVIAVALLFVGIRSGVIERSFIYFPDRDLIADPAYVGLPFEEVSFAASDGVQLHGWFVPGEKEVTWLWFHGNAGNISHRLENLKLLHDELGVSVFLFDYRGYGRSEGTPSEEGTYRDGEAALSHLRSREDVDPDRIVYFGRSLGAGIAVELAISHPPFALILESPVPSIPELARRHYPFLPVWPLLRTKYDSLAKIEKVATPLLVLHGDRDDVVPFGAGRKLFEAANEPKEFYTIRGAGHNDTYLVGGEEYFGVLRRFMENLGQ